MSQLKWLGQQKLLLLVLDQRIIQREKQLDQLVLVQLLQRAGS